MGNNISNVSSVILFPTYLLREQDRIRHQCAVCYRVLVSAKWIVGTTNTTKFNSHFITKDAIDTSSTYTFMYFTQEPRLQVLNCQTSIEQVEAYVTVARQSGNVLDFSLVDEPRSIDDPWVTACAPNPPENVEDLKGYDRGGRNIR
jgi:hypothetical protein